MAVLTAVPREAIAGDTWRFTLDLGDYTAPTWDAVFYAENGDSTFSVTASDDGASHAFSVSAATTAALKAGRYYWAIRVNDGTVYETAERGWLEVLVDPAAAGRVDRRSWARKTLDAVEATIQGRATDDQLQMSVNNRALTRHSLAELVQLRSQLRAEVEVEENAERAGLGRQIRVRLVR